MKVTLTNVRAAFISSLWEPEGIDDSEPAHAGKFIIDPKDGGNIVKCEEAMAAVAKEKWGPKAESVLENMTKTGRKPDVFFVREPYKSRNGDVYAGFEGMFFVSAKSKTRPLIIDRDRTPLVPSDGRPYGGCFVNAQIDVWAQDNKYGRALRATLTGVQFVKDGDAFTGGAPASADDFEDLSAEALA
jgi:hypothetical protein